MKTCNKESCKRKGQLLPLSEFYAQHDGKLGRMSHCKECSKARTAARQNTKEGKMARRSTILKNKYGITLQDYEAKLRQQEGRCAICKSTTSGSPYNVFHVDHNHKTGQVRGLLCVPCNMGIGWLETRAHGAAKTVIDAVGYLQKWGS